MRTFSFLVLCLMGFFFMACDDDENRLGDWALGSAWPGEVRNQAVCFVIDDYAYVGLGIGINGAEYTNFRKMNLNSRKWKRHVFTVKTTADITRWRQAHSSEKFPRSCAIP